MAPYHIDNEVVDQDISLDMERLFDPFNLDHIPEMERLKLFKKRDLSRVKFYKSAVKIFGSPSKRTRVHIAPLMETTMRLRRGKTDLENIPSKKNSQHKKPLTGVLEAEATSKDIICQSQVMVDDYKKQIVQRKKLRELLNSLGKTDEYLARKADKTQLEEKVLKQMRDAKSEVPTWKISHGDAAGTALITPNLALEDSDQRHSSKIQLGQEEGMSPEEIVDSSDHMNKTSVMEVGYKPIDDHCSPSTLGGPVASIVNHFRSEKLQEYFDVMKAFDQLGLPFTQTMLDRVLLYPGDHARHQDGVSAATHRSCLSVATREPNVASPTFGSEVTTHGAVVVTNETTVASPTHGLAVTSSIRQQFAPLAPRGSAKIISDKLFSNTSDTRGRQRPENTSQVRKIIALPDADRDNRAADVGTNIGAADFSKKPYRTSQTQLSKTQLTKTQMPKTQILSNGRQHQEPKPGSLVSKKNFVQSASSRNDQDRKPTKSSAPGPMQSGSKITLKEYRTYSQNFRSKNWHLNRKIKPGAFWPGFLLDKLRLYMDDDLIAHHGFGSSPCSENVNTCQGVGYTANNVGNAIFHRIGKTKQAYPGYNNDLNTWPVSDKGVRYGNIDEHRLLK